MKVERINENTARYTFVVSPEEFEHGLNHAYESIKPNIEIVSLEGQSQNYMNKNLVLKVYMKMH